MRLHLIVSFLFFSAAGVASATGCSSGGGGTGGGIPDPCFDYKTFKPQATEVSFATDVEEKTLRRACGISSSCHNEDPPSKTNQPFLGPSIFDQTGPATPTQIATILKGIVNVTARVPVGLNSIEDPDKMKIVDPGHPESSFIMYKLDASGTTFCDTLKCATGDHCGNSMPSQSAMLSEDERTTIRTWIAQGAKNN